MSEVPFIPTSAPFTPEQRAWLNGYFVGLLSNAHTPGAGAAQETPASKSAGPLTILFGSQTGTAEQLARRIGKEARTRGFEVELMELNGMSLEGLQKISRLLIVTSTWGDGEPPDNAANFFRALHGPNISELKSLFYSVLALGDRNYSDFCGAGRKLDERLKSLGACQLIPRMDCDVEYEACANQWMERIWTALESNSPKEISAAKTTLKVSESIPSSQKSGWNRQNPFAAPLLENRLLNGPGSTKETRHFAISLEGSGLDYEPGDALGVLPRNCPQLIQDLINLAGWNPGERVTPENGTPISMEESLLSCDLRKPTSRLLDALSKAPGCEDFSRFLAPENKPQMQEYLSQREVIDLLIDFPRFRPCPAEFLPMLGKLQPRLYSISSSPRAFPGEVHLTVAIVRYQAANRLRKGVCSTYLADRVPTGSPVSVFLQRSHGFRLPSDPSIPIIMVGPGTGIAPFRAFLQERAVAGAPGKNWLFFGDQQAACDFLYREEITNFVRSGLLSRLDTAFSRDQAEKVYVQHRMLEQAEELWRWLENGAHFYVCGDAKRMARDVDAALHEVIELAGHSAESAAEYVRQLKASKRYQRDVY